ncbi:MAG: hypothetical protein MR380_10885 [Lachnospiraceae bacterium]|nr:hypothetical protein [Lachnospiraceae bacterium]
MEKKIYEWAADKLLEWDLEKISVLGFFVGEFDEDVIDLIFASNFWEQYDEIEEKEECWNIACWEGEEGNITEECVSSSELICWLNAKGIKQVGKLNDDSFYNNGLKETIELLKTVVLKLHKDVIQKQLGHDIPILISDFEYAEEYLNITKEVNEESVIQDFVDWYISGE